MIFRKIRQIINEFRTRGQDLKLQNAELEWAHIYHDSIKDREWLKNLAISPGRWAGNYSFFYVLAKILSDYKPKNIIELGLGESSKLISAFIKNELFESKHLIIEQDKTWIEAFNKKSILSASSKIKHLALEIKTINGFPVQSYSHIIEAVNDLFDLYVVDGPFGSDNFSRYDITLLAEKLEPGCDFIIIIDDYNRQGEKETATYLVNQLTKKGIKTYSGVYAGNKTQLVIATEEYRFATSL